MAFLDFVVIGFYVFVLVSVAIFAKRRGIESLTDFFAGGKNLPWWLVGVSMVATTFAADTPLAITGIVASEGIAGNWFWWNWMVSGLITVFIYARLWKRANVLTDVEFIELRYGGKPAGFLRGFRAIYFGIPFNCVVMGWVTVGMGKVLTVLTGSSQWSIILLLYTLTAIYIAISGLWGVVVTDFVQFFLAMAGAIALAWFSVDHIGGLNALKTQLAALTSFDVLSFNPFNHPKIMLTTALVWVGMAWWAAWYPGAEPGGGGYIAQRMFSAKDERNAVGGTLLFNVANYALRPWPWIIVALVSLVVFPDITDKELGYPMMMKEVLPAGWYGLMIVAFISAFVSTISTQINWGCSYLINDFYRRFIRSDSEFEHAEQAQSHYMWASRIATLGMAAIAIVISFYFDSVKGGWEFILSLSAGLGGVLILRWFWWRVNAWSEISAMIFATLSTMILTWLNFEFAEKMIITTTITTTGWLVVTFLTSPETPETLRFYFDRVKPSGMGWKPYANGEESSLGFLGSAVFLIGLSFGSIFGFLYSMKLLLFESVTGGLGLMIFSGAVLFYVVRKI